MPVTHEHVAGTLDASVLQSPFNLDPWTRTLYVQSTHRNAEDVNNSGVDRHNPLATLVKALAVAAEGDRIIIGPGHDEAISTATALNVSLDGLQIIGVGQGYRRPRFTFDTVVGSTFTVSGDRVVLSNLHFKPMIDLLTSLVTVTGSYVDIVDCMQTQIAADGFQALVGITLGAATPYCRIVRLVSALEAAGPASCIDFQDSDFLQIIECRLSGNFSDAVINNNTTAAENVVIHGNWLDNANASDKGIDMQAGTTGEISENMIRIATDGQTTWITAAGCQLFENYGVNADGETGMLIGTPSDAL